MRSVFMRYPGGKAKALTFSYDDGVQQDRLLAEIFDKYGMKCTFNHNSDSFRGMVFSAQEIKELFLDKGHEIAVHGAFHRPTGNQRPIEGIVDVLNCRLELEKKCGRFIRGMAYPDSGITLFGNLGNYEMVKQYLTELDIVYSRTLNGDNDNFMLPADFHAWMPSAHHANAKIFEYIEKFKSIDISPKFYHARRAPRLMYIWGHSYEFDFGTGYNTWEHIENVCKALAGNDEIWYATNIEIYDYVEAYKRLVYSADGRMVYNPTLIDVWMDVDSRVYCIKSGETVCVEEAAD